MGVKKEWWVFVAIHKRFEGFIFRKLMRLKDWVFLST